ncbi:MAG: NADH-quinone oxidoreductase subunit NuoN [Proteobacteria bacterium]|nr:NADH-quinone oxidoreductase subunit NuoN [Pseudomonadota bacterium]
MTGPIQIIDFVPVVPEIFLSLAAMAFLLMGAFLGNNITRLLVKLSILVLGLAGFLLTQIGNAKMTALNGMFVSDGFAIYMKSLILGATALVLLLLRNYQKQSDKNQFELPVLMLLAVVGMMGMVSANNLIALYMSLELMSLSLYILASANRDSSRSAEAGLKYFVLGALSSGILLFGSSLVYGFTGTTNYDAIAHFLGQGHATTGVVIGFVLVLVGICFKISAVPFHMWTPDVYEGAPSVVTAFFATAPKAAALAVLIRLGMQPFGGNPFHWEHVILFASAASMIVGAVAALRQSNIKRMLAYSSIGHVGYILMGLAASSIAGTEDGIHAMLVYTAIYITMSAGAFACVIHVRRQGEPVEAISELAGLSRVQPIFAAVLSLLLLSMAGIPPLAGFFGKFFVFKAALDAGLFWLAVLGVVTSVIAAFYYIRIIKLMYFDNAHPTFDTLMSKEVKLVLTGAALFNLFYFILPSPLLLAARAAAISLISGGV